MIGAKSIGNSVSNAYIYLNDINYDDKTEHVVDGIKNIANTVKDRGKIFAEIATDKMSNFAESASDQISNFAVTASDQM